MKGQLAALARRTNLRQLVAVRGGGGGPLARPEAPSQKLIEEDELVWDDGTANPEPALDQFTLVSKYQALRWLGLGLSSFAVIGTVAYNLQPQKRTPWAPKTVFVPPEVSQA